VVAADAQLARRGDHAVGDVAVGLARGDREAAGQHGAGQCDGHQVADGEVAGAADDAAGPFRVARVDLAPPDRLLEPGQLLDLHDPAGDERAFQLRPAVDLLDLQTDAHERLADRVGGVGAGGQAVDLVGEPG